MVIEAFMAGEEASFIVMADGKTFLPSRPPRIINAALMGTRAPIPRHGRLFPGPHGPPEVELGC